MTWKHRALAGLCILALSACGPKPAEKTAASAAPSGCRAQAAAVWNGAPNTTLNITGKYDGDCVTGDATLTITGPDGGELYTFALPIAVASNTVFADAKTQDAMTAALAQWISPAANTTMQDTGALPAWAAKDEQPGNAEFPFMPEISREAYAALRKQKLPLYCHVQGGESQACVVYDAKTKKIARVGLQRFPG